MCTTRKGTNGQIDRYVTEIHDTIGYAIRRCETSLQTEADSVLTCMDIDTLHILDSTDLDADANTNKNTSHLIKWYKVTTIIEPHDVNSAVPESIHGSNFLFPFVSMYCMRILICIHTHIIKEEATNNMYITSDNHLYE